MCDIDVGRRSYALPVVGTWRSHSVAGCRRFSFQSSVTGFTLLAGVGREMPNFFILAIRVVRFSPSLSAAPAKNLDKMRHQLRDITLAFAQRGQHDRKYIQTIVEIDSELAAPGHLG